MQKIALVLLLSCFTLSGFAQVRDSITLKTATGDIYGTLTLPKNKRKVESVVLIVPGSGPTDRYGNNGIFVSYVLQILSDSLAKHGIASVRYDKRGLAASHAAVSGESALRFWTYGDDVADWIRMLHKDKRFKKVFVVGHSEGSLVAMLALQKVDAAGFISVAGAGEPADVTIMRQIHAYPNNPKVLVDSMQLIIDALKKEGHYSPVPKGIYQRLFRPSVQGYVASWFMYNPTQEIQKLHLPILIIQGKKDLQIDTAQAENLKAAKPDAELVYIPEMNHIFRDVATNDVHDNMLTYTEDKTPIDGLFVETVVGFIRRNEKGKRR
ncbi:MAG: alpha/beta fold hydrolase [Chitinophagaceae bacterium]